MVYASNDWTLVKWLETRLAEAFKVKILDKLQKFIGWELRYTENDVHVGQRKYINRILSEKNMTHVKPVDTPLPTKCDMPVIHPNETQLDPEQHNRYRSIVGSLSYLGICTRPDISFAVSVLARQLHAPCKRHLLLVKRVLRYVSVTSDKEIFYPRCQINSSPLTAYTDADWAGCNDKRR